MFSKVLVANRGEIAVRVLQTLQAMGIATVAVYSDPDAQAPHVTLADESYALSGVSAEETYLDRHKIIGLAKEAKADAVHPGYGFLSENPSFCADCTDAGVVFIGPGADTISLLGDKIRSKETAIQARGVDTLSLGCSEVDTHFIEQLAETGQLEMCGWILKRLKIILGKNGISNIEGLKQAFREINGQGINSLTDYDTGLLALPRIQEAMAVLNRLRPPGG